MPSKCAGPLSGLDYPHYDGILKGNLHSVCFVCGEPATGALRPKGGQLIGVCDKHKEALFDFSGAVDGRPETAESLQVEEKD